jgi:hypothetical protein
MSHFHSAFLAVTGVLLVAASIAAAEDFITRQGKAFKNAEIIKVMPDGIRIIHADGISTVRFEDLTDKQRTEYGLSNTGTTAYRKEQTKAKEIEETARARAVSEAQEERRLDKLPRYSVSGKVLRVLSENRVVLQIFRNRIPSDPLTRIGGGYRNVVRGDVSRDPNEPFVLVTNVPSSKKGYAEGQSVRFQCIQRNTEKVVGMTLRIYQVRPEGKSR